MSELAQYSAMRIAVQQCATVDEAADIRDKAAALAAYAKQRDDIELQQWVSEIKLRACQRIGQISAALQKGAPSRGHGHEVPSSGKFKAETLSAGRISTSTAHRYEELAGGTEAQAQATATAATEAYFATTKATKQVPTMNGFRQAVRGALEETFGPRPPRQTEPKHEPSPIATDWVDFTGAVKDVAELPCDMAAIAAHSRQLTPLLLQEARTALARLTSWIEYLEEYNAKRQRASA